MTDICDSQPLGGSMSKKAKNDLSRYGVTASSARGPSDVQVVPCPGGGWVVRNMSTGQLISVGSAEPAGTSSQQSSHADLMKAIDAVIARHIDVLRKLAKR